MHLQEEELRRQLTGGPRTVSQAFGVTFSTERLRLVHKLVSAQALRNAGSQKAHLPTPELVESIMVHCRTIADRRGAQPAPITAAADPGG